jgi:hypothetical protein
MHPNEAARLLDHLLELLDSLAGQIRIPSPDVAIEFRANGMVDCFGKP